MNKLSGICFCVASTIAVMCFFSLKEYVAASISIFSIYYVVAQVN